MKILKNKLKKFKNLKLLIVFLLLLIIFNIKPIFFKDVLSMPINGIQRIIFSINMNIKGFFEDISNYGEMKKENTELIKQNKLLEESIGDYNSVKRYNEELRLKLNLSDTNLNYKYISCNIINKSNNSKSIYVIDKGTTSGVDKGMLVVSDGKLFGQVNYVTSNWCTVETDRNNQSIEVTTLGDIKNSNLMLYQKQSKENLYSINVSYDVNIGDIVITKYTLLYPRGIEIGKIVDVKKQEDCMDKNVIIQSHELSTNIKNLSIVVPTTNLN